MRWFVKIQTLGFILLLFCPKSPELLVAVLQDSQGFCTCLQSYRGIVPAGRDSLTIRKLLPVPQVVGSPKHGLLYTAEAAKLCWAQGGSRGIIFT